ncbi:unannotated protein [freshwater metagenome]|uniref:Unannotated protein n=1 Tax=freshwater metagenome TaxID=449393 RepID=A0A6J6PV16_9ZZZZ
MNVIVLTPTADGASGVTKSVIVGRTVVGGGASGLTDIAAASGETLAEPEPPKPGRKATKSPEAVKANNATTAPTTRHRRGCIAEGGFEGGTTQGLPTEVRIR